MKNYNITGTGNLNVGHLTKIADDAKFIFNEPGSITIGDYCTIGPGVKFVCSGGDIKISDWTTLHDNCLVLSGNHLSIDQHCWFGQNCIIDGSGGLKIGRGVRVGMYSQIWSHVAAGEQIEGCTLYGEREVKIEDNVWLVGSCIVASGVTIGRRTVALIGSNITKSFPENSTIAGTPASQKSNLSFYKDISLDEKWKLINKWIPLACTTSNINMRIASENLIELISERGDEKMFFAKDTAIATLTRISESESTVCCVEDKTYNKKFTSIEQKILKFLCGNKARFYTN